MASRKGSAQMPAEESQPVTKDSTLVTANGQSQRNEVDVWPDTTDDEGVEYSMISKPTISVPSEIEKPALDIWPDTSGDEGSRDTDSKDSAIMAVPRSAKSQMNGGTEVVDNGKALRRESEGPPKDGNEQEEDGGSQMDNDQIDVSDQERRVSSRGDREQGLPSEGTSRGSTLHEEITGRSEVLASATSPTEASSKSSTKSKPRSQTVAETVRSLQQRSDQSSNSSRFTLIQRKNQPVVEHAAEKEARDYIALISQSRKESSNSSFSPSSNADQKSRLPVTPSHLLKLNDQTYFSLQPVERKATPIGQSTRSSEVAELDLGSRTPSFARTTRRNVSGFSIGQISNKDELQQRLPSSLGHLQYTEKTMSPHVHIQSPTGLSLASSAEVSSLTSIAGHKEHHGKLSDLIRNAIIGFSDGLTVPFALVAGLSALEDRKVTILGGLAELFAGTLSMGLGALLAAFTERMRYDSEERREWREVAEEPLAEEEEIFEILGKYGVSRSASAPVVESLKGNEDMWVRFMMDFELQLKKPTKREAYLESLVMGVSYFIGGIFPLIPFLVLPEEKIYTALFCAVGVSAALLLLFGFAKSKVAGATHKKAILGAVQMLCIGALAAGLSYAIVWGLMKG